MPRKPKTPPRRIAPWLRPEEEEDTPAFGPGAVLRTGKTPGQKNRLFPELDIGATARNLGISRPYLAGVLSGKTSPSLRVAVKIADALQKDLSYIAALAGCYKL